MQNNSELSKEQLVEYIKKYFSILENNFNIKTGKKIPYPEICDMCHEVNNMLNKLAVYDAKIAGQIAKLKFIPILDLLLRIVKNSNDLYRYEGFLKNSYKLAARISLEHYMIYREWEDETKFFAPRYEILSGYIHFLQEVATNPKFRLLIFNAPSGYGKLIANDIPVLTKDGWKKHGDLKVGDYVISPNGDFVRVNIVHSKRLANVKVTFEDGEEILCHNQHEWCVYDRLARKTKERIETTYIMQNLKEKSGRNRFLIPLREMVKGEHKDLPVDPYTYGVWLGDGITKQGKITQNNKDLKIFNYIPYDISSSFNGVSENVKTFTVKGLAKDLHKLNLCYQDKNIEKYIHDSYLTADIEQRLELLAGIIDTDGYLDKNKQRYVISTCGEKLKNDIITLISTFGWRTSVTTVNPSVSTSGIVGRKKVYYIGFSPTIKIPCKLKRKQLIKVHKQRRIGICNVELIDPTEGNCITVDGGLYLVGKTLKTTHNTFPEKISEAWNFGIDPTGTVLSLCSNEDVVKGGSRTVIDEIKSPAFGEVFPNLKWSEEDKNFFLKETESNWKLRDCKLTSSYYAKTTQSNVVGTRASQRIHIDDLYPDYQEAMNMSLNEYYMNKYLTVWTKRFVQNLIPKVVVTGTLWASGDFIALLIQLIEKQHNMRPHKKYKYCRTNEDETIVIIQVPALDYETGESTCPEVKSTEEVLEDKNNMDEYLFETNFQQIPTDPEALTFSYNNLRQYEKIPKTDYIGTYSVIDATRKSGADYFAMPIFTKVPFENTFDYFLKDCLFTRTATKDMYDDIVDKIIEHHIILLVIESNVTSELKKQLDIRLEKRGVFFCVIVEKYNVENKQARITDQKGIIKRRLVFPKKGLHGKNTEMGRFMDNLTLYNETGRNPNDDAPDSCALFSSEIVEGGSKPAKPKAIKRPF